MPVGRGAHLHLDKKGKITLTFTDYCEQVLDKKRVFGGGEDASTTAVSTPEDDEVELVSTLE